MQKRKLITRGFIIFICLLLLSIKIPFPTFILRASDIHCESISQIKESDRSIWFYKPLSDTLLIQDSVRNIKFQVQQACAYDAHFMHNPHIQFLLPWADIVNFNDLYFFGIWFDQMDMVGKLSTVRGIWFTVDSISHNAVDRSAQRWDDFEKGFSYYGVRINAPLPDTLYFTVWGYPGLYADKTTFRSLSDNEQDSILHKSYSLSESKQALVLGEITFVKSDSIINSKKRKEHERRLLFGNL